MKIIQTEHFQLAINTKGNPSSEKLAICLPGRLDTKDYINFISHINCLSQKGYYAISIDPPGTWASPGSIELFTTTNYIKAVNELIEYFGNKNTLLLGHSRGGQVAMLVGTTNPNVTSFIAINASYGPPSPPETDQIQDEAVIDYRDLPPGITKSDKQKEFRLPLNYFEDGQKYDPIPLLMKCNKPKLIIYSLKDEFTEPEEVLDIYANIPEPKILYAVNSDHDYRYHPDIIEEINTVIGKFIEK